MLNEKMQAVMEEVNSQLAEREELVRAIAVSLLTKTNLLVIGAPGQSKSQAIDLFCARVDCRTMRILMNPGTDRDELMGRLDLASMIPGGVPRSVLSKDAVYGSMLEGLHRLLEAGDLEDARTKQQEIQAYRRCLAEMYGGKPTYCTEDKIPQSEIVFLDEIFKSSNGVLNSLLQALNERTYTNEGITAPIPTISFIGASNELPDFQDPEKEVLRALYDRFSLKIITEYIQDKENRMRVLRAKQTGSSPGTLTVITLPELEQMQREVRQVEIPDSINQTVDILLCELRDKGVFVSDRTFLNYGRIVQAEAWLHGRKAVGPGDLYILSHYLWDKPEDRPVVADALRSMLQNPLGDKLEALLADAYEARDIFAADNDHNRALLQLRDKLLEIYQSGMDLIGCAPDSDAVQKCSQHFTSEMEQICRDAYAKTAFTYVSLAELAAYKKMEVA